MIMVRINSPVAVNPPGQKGWEPAAGAAPGFSDILGQAVNQVNQLQIQANRAAEGLAAGQVEDLAGVMITTEKAKLAMELTLQIRNKLLEAYQEIMRMQV